MKKYLEYKILFGLGNLKRKSVARFFERENILNYIKSKHIKSEPYKKRMYKKRAYKK